jgi:hypothetical protein
MRTLVMVHGRAQEHKDAVRLKKEWVEALTGGLRSQGLELPIPETAIRFPYYGQTLYDLVHGRSLSEAAEVIVRGEDLNRQEEEFLREVLNEVFEKVGITENQIREVGGESVIEKGPLNWEWVQTGLKAIDRFVPGASGATVALVTRDVYQYLRNPGLRDVLESGVRKAIASGEETVVVSHSLGTVVAYNLLRREGAAQGWKVPVFVTLGSPLGVAAITRAVRPLEHPSVVSTWFNALDEGDVVALYPLDQNRFPVQPAIENWRGVQNTTSNQHGITGYLSDGRVARRIYDALTA